MLASATHAFQEIFGLLLSKLSNIIEIKVSTVIGLVPKRDDTRWSSCYDLFIEDNVFSCR